MANGIITLKSTKSNLEGRIVWESSNNGPIKNTSTVIGTLQVRRNDGYTTKGTWNGFLTVADTTNNFSNPSTSVGSNWVTMTKVTRNNFPHGEDGTSKCWLNAECNAPSGTSLEGATTSGSDTVTLDKIARYANFSKHQLNKVTIHKVRILYRPDRTITTVQYSLNGGDWKSPTIISGTSTSANNDVVYEVSGLNANTSYTIKTRIQCNGLWTESSIIKFTTYDIARLTNVPNANIGASQNIQWSNPGGATLKLKLCKTDNTTIIDYGTVTGANKSVTPTASTIYALTPNANTYKARYILTTTLDGISDTNSKDFTFTVTNSNPTFSNFTFKDTNSKTIALTGNNQKFIKGYSNLQATVSTANKAIAKNFATMKTYTLTTGTKNSGDVAYSSSADVNLSVSAIDNNVVFVRAKDSRQNTTAVQKTISSDNYYTYTNLVITKCNLNRSDGGVGTETTLSYAGTFWNKSFGSVANAIASIKYEYKISGTSTWIRGNTNLSPTISGNNFSQTLIIQGDLAGSGFDDANNYDFRLTISDKLNTKVYTTILASGTPLVAYHKKRTSNRSKI